MNRPKKAESYNKFSPRGHSVIFHTYIFFLEAFIYLSTPLTLLTIDICAIA